MSDLSSSFFLSRVRDTLGEVKAAAIVSVGSLVATLSSLGVSLVAATCRKRASTRLTLLVT